MSCLIIKLILNSGRYVPFGACQKSQSRVTAASATTYLACYCYIKRSTSDLSLLVSTHRNCFMVFVQFRGRLVQQYRACVIDSLGRVLYHCTMCTRHPDLVFSVYFAIPIFHILILDICLSPLIFNHNS